MSNYAALTQEEVKEIMRFEEAFKASFKKEVVLVAYGK